jgi:hypothetical protein
LHLLVLHDHPKILAPNTYHSVTYCTAKPTEMALALLFLYNYNFSPICIPAKCMLLARLIPCTFSVFMWFGCDISRRYETTSYTYGICFQLYNQVCKTLHLNYCNRLSFLKLYVSEIGTILFLRVNRTKRKSVYLRTQKSLYLSYPLHQRNKRER